LALLLIRNLHLGRRTRVLYLRHHLALVIDFRCHGVQFVIGQLLLLVERADLARNGNEFFVRPVSARQPGHCQNARRYAGGRNRGDPADGPHSPGMCRVCLQKDIVRTLS
jgi:hypothetical protein